MKNLLLASLLLISSNVFASKIVNTKSMTNRVLNTSFNEIKSTSLNSLSGTRKVLELKGTATSTQGLRQNAVAQALHGLCNFFDEGVNVELQAKNEAGSAKAHARYVDGQAGSDTEADIAKILKSIKAANAEAGVELYTGEAGGNNTFGTVLGFYDVKNNEMAIFSITNCGSDN